MDLEPISSASLPPDDKRPRLAEPPPVRLVAVENCSLPVVAGMEGLLDAFYIELLKFERDAQNPVWVYRAENFELVFVPIPQAQPRADQRALGVAVPSLNLLRKELEQQRIEYLYQRGITPGSETVLIFDPAGNPLEISEFRMAI